MDNLNIAELVTVTTEFYYSVKNAKIATKFVGEDTNLYVAVTVESLYSDIFELECIKEINEAQKQEIAAVLNVSTDDLTLISKDEYERNIDNDED